jgi:hypothetical protein
MINIQTKEVNMDKTALKSLQASVVGIKKKHMEGAKVSSLDVAMLAAAIDNIIEYLLKKSN